jgi:hypothetical protein
MIQPKRFSDEKKQELISRSQLYERLVDFGWLPNSPEDLGEDFFVHVYYEGRATGVAFYIQLKSVTNLTERKRKESIIYPFPIKDLLHWETFSYPVVLVVWDINLREGRWSLLSIAISELDRRKPTWRKNKRSASVKLSWKNTFSDDGLIRLRESVGKIVYLLISQGKSLT